VVAYTNTVGNYDNQQQQPLLKAPIIVTCVLFLAPASLCQSRSVVEAVLCRVGPNGSIRNTTANIEPVNHALAETDPTDVPANCPSPTGTKEEIPYHTRYYQKREQPLIKEKA
jgi:hypothetical protein